MFISRVRVKPDISKLSQLSSLLRHNGYGSHQLLYDLFPGSKSRVFLFREEIAKEQLKEPKVKGEPVYYVVSSTEPSNAGPLFSVESKPYFPKLEAGDRLFFTLRANPTVARMTQGKKNSIRHDVVMDTQRVFHNNLGTLLNVSTDGAKADVRRRLYTKVNAGDAGAQEYLETTIKENERYAELLERNLGYSDLFDVAIKASTDKALESWLIEKGRRNGFLLARDLKKGFLKFQAEGYRWHALPKKGRTAGFSTVDFEGELEVTEPNLFVDALYSGIGPAKGFGCGLMLVRRL